MNNIEKYRDKQAASYDNALSSMAEAVWMPQGYKEGFNAAIALELPIKFLIWYIRNALPALTFGDHDLTPKQVQDLKKALEPVKRTTDEAEAEVMYQYWIENIFKP